MTNKQRIDNKIKLTKEKLSDYKKGLKAHKSFVKIAKNLIDKYTIELHKLEADRDKMEQKEDSNYFKW